MPKKRSASVKSADDVAAGGAPYDPGAPVEIALRFDSPHVVTYHLWFALPGGPWQKFASGTDEDVVTVTGHRHVIGPLLAGSKIAYLVLFVGNPQTTYRGQVTLSQSAQILDGGLLPLAGQTNADGAAVERGEVTLQ